MATPTAIPNRRMDNYTRFGYSLEVKMMLILKRKDFARWQAGEKLPDTTLCKAAKEMESGLIDADLGGHLYKQRVARPGGGKSGGYRTLLSARIGSRYVFLHGFPKSDKANIAQDEKKALQFTGKVFLELSPEALSKALQAGVLLEVHCEQDH
ncbi:type II toxin-antitoxin system RelE/ParE family toxin [Dyella terrae]|nr:type II toxin-antitoxin system RelE/ParE family toxin [Dyella terrae]